MTTDVVYRPDIMDAMKSYEASASIEASPDDVWAVLTDYADYPNWDSGVTKLEGTAVEGGKILVTAAINPKRAFKLKVADLTKPSKMVWKGGLPLGLFRGVRTFTLTPAMHGKDTNLHVREVFTGPLVGLIWKTMPDLQPSFDQFAAGLKARAEGRPVGSDS